VRRGIGTLGGRIFLRVHCTRLLLSLLLIVSSACSDSAPTPEATREPPPSPARASAATDTSVSSWPTAYGTLIVVPAPSGEGAALIPPLAPSVSTAPVALGPIEGLDVELFSRGGLTALGVLGAVAVPTSSCPAWPQAPVATDAPWRVGLGRDVATAIPLDSIEGLPPSDSLRLAIAVARLASRTPGDSVERFAGLPYVVRNAWRGVLPDGPQLLIAIVARTLAVEDDPAAEQILLLAESATAGATPQLVYSERRWGREAAVDIDEVLALVRFSATGAVGLLVERADARGPMLLLLERASETSGWSLRWQGPRAGC
jgi:hypothetical protein